MKQNIEALIKAVQDNDGSARSELVEALRDDKVAPTYNLDADAGRDWGYIDAWALDDSGKLLVEINDGEESYYGYKDDKVTCNEDLACYREETGNLDPDETDA